MIQYVSMLANVLPYVFLVQNAFPLHASYIRDKLDLVVALLYKQLRYNSDDSFVDTIYIRLSHLGFSLKVHEN